MKRRRACWFYLREVAVKQYANRKKSGCHEIRGQNMAQVLRATKLEIDFKKTTQGTANRSPLKSSSPVVTNTSDKSLWLA